LLSYLVILNCFLFCLVNPQFNVRVIKITLPYLKGYLV